MNAHYNKLNSAKAVCVWVVAFSVVFGLAARNTLAAGPTGERLLKMLVGRNETVRLRTIVLLQADEARRH